MNRVCKIVFISSLLLYMGSTFYTRMSNCRLSCFLSKILYSLPLDAFPMKYMGAEDSSYTQVGVLSTEEVVGLLQSNATTLPYMQNGVSLEKSKEHRVTSQDYFVLRIRNGCSTKWGDIKVYFPYLPYSVTQFVYLSGKPNEYLNLILPYSPSLDSELSESSQCFIRWKNRWGDG